MVADAMRLTDAVKLWWARVASWEAHVPLLLDVLSPSECLRADRYRFARPRTQFIIARGILRRLLEAHLGVPAASVPISTSPDGKPLLGGGAARDVGFSLAHTGDLIVYAIADGRDVGIDVESLGDRHVSPFGLAKLYTHAERKALDESTSLQRQLLALSLWTCKEAYGKAIGRGLRPPVAGFDEFVRCRGFDQDPPTMWRYRWGDRAWWVYRFAPAVGYIGALVVSAAPTEPELECPITLAEVLPPEARNVQDREPATRLPAPS
jgi:4'-phosphopantetheinyl transferase